MTHTGSPELHYMLLVIGIFIIPKALQRFRIPGAITCVCLGAALGIGPHLFHGDAAVKLLSTLGIVSMFLFAGLEVDLTELKQGRKVLLQHLAIQFLVTAAGTAVIHYVLGLEVRPSILFALALFTPSTGFILDSLQSFGFSSEERFWVKSKAIAAELLALGLLFVTIQSESVTSLLLSALAMVIIVAILPPLFRVFSRIILPFAPNTEFTFLIIVALLCAYLTRALGVYYLVGAFVVGLAAVRLRKNHPALSSDKLLGGVELFASFFIPFYFLSAGLHLRAEQFTWVTVSIAATLLVLVFPFQIYRVALHRHFVLKEAWRTGARIGTAVAPTLVFTIVIAEILQERFDLSNSLFGALIIFTLVNTLIPALILHVPPPEYETPEVPRSGVVPLPAPSADNTTSSNRGVTDQ